MTNLQKLEAAIRKALPELMELSEGCEFMIEFVSGVLTYVSKLDGDVVFFLNCDRGPEIVESEWFNKQDIKIIGHPVTILHLLRWLDIVCNKHSFQYSITDSSLYTTRPFKTYKLNLSKPLLSQQSQEVIDELAKLVK